MPINSVSHNNSGLPSSPLKTTTHHQQNTLGSPQFIDHASGTIRSLPVTYEKVCDRSGYCLLRVKPVQIGITMFGEKPVMPKHSEIRESNPERTTKNTTRKTRSSNDSTSDHEAEQDTTYLTSYVDPNHDDYKGIVPRSNDQQLNINRSDFITTRSPSPHRDHTLPTTVAGTPSQPDRSKPSRRKGKRYRRGIQTPYKVSSHTTDSEADRIKRIQDLLTQLEEQS